MQRLLNTTQILLLNNLVYMKKKGLFLQNSDDYGKTIAYLIKRIDLSKMKDEDYSRSLVTLEDWKDILQAIRLDKQLMNMKIAATRTKEAKQSSEGLLFLEEISREAVVALESTRKTEWLDNFQGGGSTDSLDGVSTAAQEKALSWFQSLPLPLDYRITVTGYSKGGNKAKYITIMNESVDRCLSFNGQGFSDEFIQQYFNRIIYSQYKIENHNVDADYVNFLLKDIGTTIFYQAQNIGKRGFLENHAPNTFFQFKNGQAFMAQGEQDRKMEAADYLVDSILGRLEGRKKKKLLNFIGKMVERGFN